MKLEFGERSLKMNATLGRNTSSEYTLSSKDHVLWATLFFTEAITVLFVNCLSLVIFLKKKFLVKKSTYLIICLTMSDFLVGISVLMTAVDIYTEEMRSNVGGYLKRIKTSLTAGTVMLSLLLLALIALERLFAIVWPLRHRLSKASHYFYGIGSCWLVAISLSLSITFPQKSLNIFGNVAVILGSIMLVIIFACYLTIWIKIKCFRAPTESKRSNLENKKLAKTLFIITVSSLLIYVPKLAVTFTNMHCQNCNITLSMGYGTDFIMYINSFLNLIVYSCRMPEFRKELKALSCVRILSSCLSGFKCLKAREERRNGTVTCRLSK
jgi:rotatin